MWRSSKSIVGLGLPGRRVFLFALRIIEVVLLVSGVLLNSICTL